MQITDTQKVSLNNIYFFQVIHVIVTTTTTTWLISMTTVLSFQIVIKDFLLVSFILITTSLAEIAVRSQIQNVYTCRCEIFTLYISQLIMSNCHYKVWDIFCYETLLAFFSISYFDSPPLYNITKWYSRGYTVNSFISFIGRRATIFAWIPIVAHGRGEECKHDFDGDRVKDKNDACPRDATMTALDFTKHIVFRPDGESTTNTAAWKVQNDGRQVSKGGADNDNSIFIGEHFIFMNSWNCG